MLRGFRGPCKMYELNQARARAKEFLQLAKSAPNDDDKNSYLAIADSWNMTADLTRQLSRQERGLERGAA